MLERDRYRLRDRRDRKVHDEFSVKRLKRYPACADGDVIPDSDYYIIDHIVDRRERSDGVFEYRIRWLGYLPADDTWEPVDTFTSAAMEEVMSYNLRHPVVSGAPEEAPKQEDVDSPPVAPTEQTDSDLRQQRREQRAAEKERRRAKT